MADLTFVDRLNPHTNGLVLVGGAVALRAEGTPLRIYSVTIKTPPCKVDVPFLRGDTDGSGVIDISDPIFNLNFQFVGGIDELPCEDAADVDDSGVVDISDPIYNLTFQFVGGIAPPPAPGPTTCGQDPTGDGLDCTGYPQDKC